MNREQFKRLKIGDKVLIRKDLIVDHYYGNESFVYKMLANLGKVVTVGDLFISRFEFTINEDYNCYFYTPEMIDRKYFIFGR